MHLFTLNFLSERYGRGETTKNQPIYYQLTLIYLFPGPSFLQYVKNRFSIFRPWVWVSYLIHAPPWNKQNKPFDPPKISGWKRIYVLLECHLLQVQAVSFQLEVDSQPKRRFHLWCSSDTVSCQGGWQFHPQTKTWWATATKPWHDIPLDLFRDLKKSLLTQ